MNLKSSKNRTILAVDDKIENLKVLIAYLENSGFELMVAQSGEEAFQHIKRVIPDMILLDILMPGIDGFETCRRLKINDATKDIPVIFMTALTDTLDKVKGFEVGAIDYLTKPLQQEEVLARVNAHINTRDFQQQLQEKNVSLQQQITTYSNLMQMESSVGPIIAESPAMRRVQEQIAGIAQNTAPTFITGEPGTGQVYIAKKIHERLGITYAPLIVVDCLRVEDNEASKLLFGSTELKGSESQAGGFGALHLANNGTLVLMNIDSLGITSQRILSKYLEESADGEDIPHIHLIATANEDIESLVETCRLLPGLAEQLATNELNMPNMRKRKRDILPLAKLFLTEHDRRLHDGEFRLSRSAEHMLLSGQYRHRNAEELREAVKSAAFFADGQEIDAEHIFIGPKSEGTKFDYNLSQLRPVQWLLRSRTPIVVLQSIVFVLFLSLILICLISGNSLPGRIANSLILGVWEPALIFVFLLVGRAWCTVCPLSSAGYLIKQIGHFKMNPPQWLMKHTGWLIVMLFFLVIWSEQVFHMTEYPFRTGILLLALMIAAMFFSVLYKRETWCRYLCPLGNLGATYATAAPVYVRANPSVCAAQCTTHECYKGSATAPECPVFHHPLYARDAHFCKMCLSCLSSCPHGSANLYLRPPIQSIWRKGDLNPTLTPLALVVFFLAIVLLGARNTTWLTNPYIFTTVAVLAVAIAFALYTSLPSLLSRERNPDHALVSRVALVLFILGWGPFMAFYLHEVPGLAALQIRFVEESFWIVYLPIKEIAVLSIMQIIVVLMAAVFAMISFRKIWLQFKWQKMKVNPWGWRILQGLCTFYLLIAVGLIMF